MRLLLMCGGEVSGGAEVTEGSWRESVRGGVEGGGGR